MRRPTLLAVLAAALLAATPAAAFTPHHGTYSGPTNHHPMQIAFRYQGHHVVDVRVGTVWAFDSVTVDSHGWRIRGAHGHRSIDGHWTSATHVRGTYAYWRPSSHGPVQVHITWEAKLEA